MSKQTGLREALRKAGQVLGQHGTDFAVVGALAVGARSEPRFTRDVDIAIAVDSDHEAEQLIYFLLRSGYQLHSLFAHEETGEIHTARLVHGDTPGVVTDFLFQTSGIEREVVFRAEIFDVFEDEPVKVAQAGDLIAMKILSRRDDRPQDQTDLVHLLKAATHEDLQLAEQSVKLIEQRKNTEGRDLSRELQEQRGKFCPRQEQKQTRPSTTVDMITVIRREAPGDFGVQAANEQDAARLLKGALRRSSDLRSRLAALEVGESLELSSSDLKREPEQQRNEPELDDD